MAKVELPLSCFETVFRWYPDMRWASKDWCDKNLQAHPTFEKIGGIRERYYATFATDTDAMFFLLTWVG